MLSHRERMLGISRQFALNLARRSRGNVKGIWLFGSLADGKELPGDADFAVEIISTATAHDTVVTLIKSIARGGRFHGIRIDATLVTRSELASGNDGIERGVRKHNHKLWPS